MSGAVQPKRGALIVVEGLDRAGKSTQVERLCQNLAKDGHHVETLKFPDRTTKIGHCIDEYLRNVVKQINDQAIHLLFSANRWEFVADMQAKIEKGTTLIVDRYSFSGAVYSAAKLNTLLDLSWAWAPEIGLPEPDLLVFLTISPEGAGRRTGFGVERYEKDEMQQQVRKGFQELLSLESLRKIPLVEIDAERDVNAVENDVLKAARELMLSKRLSGPLERLGSL